jgi:meckelin
MNERFDMIEGTFTPGSKKKGSAVPVVIFVVLALSFLRVQGQKHVAVTKSCKADEYFDITLLECTACKDTLVVNTLSHKIPDMSKLGPNGLPISCTCEPGYIKVPTAEALTRSTGVYTISPDFTCQACPANHAASEDKTLCMQCSSTATTFNATSNTTTVVVNGPTSSVLDATTKECKCTSGESYFLREKDLSGNYLSAKVCSPCPYRTLARVDPRVCTACPHPNMTFTTLSGGKKACDCDPGFYKTGVDGLPPQYGEVSCLPNGKLIPQVGNLKLEYTTITGAGLSRKEETVKLTQDSLIFQHYSHIAISRCAYYGGPDDNRYCEIAANLCALRLLSSDSTACTYMLERLIIPRNTYPSKSAPSEWVKSVPWLLYSDEGNAVAESRAIEQKMSLDAAAIPNTFDRLNFTLAKYSLNGDFLGFEQLRTQLYYCNRRSKAYDSGSTSSSSDSRGTGGGLNEKPTYGVPPSGDTRWLKYGSGYSEEYWCDLESLVENNETIFYDLYVYDAAASTAEVDKLYPVPVKIENYVDNSKQTPNVNENGDVTDDVYSRRFFLYDSISSIETLNGAPAVLRYADKISFEIKMIPSLGDLSKVGKTYPPVLTIHYSDRQLDDTNGFVGAKKTAKLKFEAVYTQDTLELLNTFQVFFGIACALAVMQFMVRLMSVYRMNSRPGADWEVDGKLGFRILSWAFSSFSYMMFLFLFILCFVGIFLPFKAQNDLFIMLPVDRKAWLEKNDYYPFRVVLVMCFAGQVLRIIEIVMVQCGVEVFFMDWEKTRGKLANTKDSESGKSKKAPISAWRTIFVANEWNEMQSARKINVEFTIIMSLFLLVGLDWQYLATSVPAGSDLTPGPVNPILRFVNICWIWITLEALQLIWNWAIWERFVEEPAETQFHDMCTIAKVSVFILDERYHGYYLHCRSPHEHADANMVEIAKDLKKMEESLVVQDPMPGVPKQGENPKFTSFEVNVSKDWRERYDRTVSQTSRASQDAGKDAIAVRNLKAQKKLNGFLQSFVDKTDPEFDRIWRDSVAMNWCCRVPPETSEKSILLGDDKSLFTSVLFLGVEFDLMVFNILTWAVVDLWAGDDTGNNPALAAFITYISDKLLRYVRGNLGTSNLHAKTYVDERFLF